MIFTLLAQAALPPPDAKYFARTEYSGPGLVCGAAFAFQLSVGESAVLRKPSAIDETVTFHTSDGEFSVHESQYATAGGDLFQKTPLGRIELKQQNGQYIWIYRDAMPGSTDVFGPAVNGPKPSPAFRRILFGGPTLGMVGGERCLAGKGLDER